MAAAKQTAAKNSSKTSGGKSTQSQKKDTAASKNSAKTKTSGKADAIKAAKERETRRMWSYILFFFGILELLLTFIKGEGLWNSIYLLNRGIFGVSVFLFAPMIIYVSLMIASDTTHNKVIAKVSEGAVLMALISGAAQVFLVGSVDGASFWKKLVGLYNDGIKLKGGGLAGAIIGWPLLSLFKKVGAGIIIVLAAFTFIMLLTDVTLPQLLKAISKPFVSGAKAVTRDRAEHAAEYSQRQQENLYASQNNKNATQEVSKPKTDIKKGKTGRVDIARFYPDDNPDTAPEAYLPVDENYSEDNFERPDIKLPSHPIKSTPPVNSQPKENVPKDSQTEKKPQDDLENIIKKAINEPAVKNQRQREQSALKNNEGKNKLVNVETNGQTTMFDDEDKIEAYVNPPIEILKYPAIRPDEHIISQEMSENSARLVETLETYGVKTRVAEIHRGPSVTRYELQLAAGVKVSKIVGLADDIALNLAALSVRIEAPVPGKPYVGIEIPNKNRDTVTLRDLIESSEYKNATGKLSFAVGKDIEGKIVIGDIAKMPHLLVAGTTGSGKSVFTNSIILSVLYHASPEEVKLILIDPKKVEFPIYNKIPHLLIPVVTDPLKAAGALGWAVNEMNKRYLRFEACNVKNLDEFNEMLEENSQRPIELQDEALEDCQPMPQILIVIDEFADLMMAAGSEVEDSVIRLGQLARAAGIHMVIATQSPRKDVITGLIKSNIPSRVSLSVSSNIDSRVILDMSGAEKLLGNGDLLYKPVGMKNPIRIQSGYASTREIKDVVSFLKNEQDSDYSQDIIREVEENMPKPKEEKNTLAEEITINPDDDLIAQAISLIVQTGNASTSFLQRKLKLGFARAARIMDEIEERGIIGPQDGSKPREILISEQEWLEMQARK